MMVAREDEIKEVRTNTKSRFISIGDIRWHKMLPMSE